MITQSVEPTQSQNANPINNTNKPSPARKQLTLSGELVDAATLAPATGQALAFGGHINRKIIDLT